MALDDAYRSGTSRFADLAIERAQFQAFVDERVEAPVTNPEIADDLFLACACLRGSAAAIAELEARLLSQVPQFLAKVESNRAAVEEVQQQLRERLLVGRGDARPKLAEYSGHGRLASWLRVVAIRTALNLKSARKPGSSDVPPDMLGAEDPELSYLRERYARQFHDAFVAALGKLERRERNVLRMHLLDGLNVDRIGQLHDVHRATAARWLARAREQLFEETRALLRSELGLSETEFASIVRLVRSELDVSICRILQEQAG